MVQSSNTGHYGEDPSYTPAFWFLRNKAELRILIQGVFPGETDEVVREAEQEWGEARQGVVENEIPWRPVLRGSLESDASVLVVPGSRRAGLSYSITHLSLTKQTLFVGQMGNTPGMATRWLQFFRREW